MALINCPDCSTAVSDQAVSCVKCGRPIRRDTRYQKIQKFWTHTFIPAIQKITIVMLTCFLGMIAKFFHLVFANSEAAGKLTFTELGKVLIAESGLFIVVSILILAIIVKNRWIEWLNVFFPEPLQETVITQPSKNQDCQQIFFEHSITMDRGVK